MVLPRRLPREHSRYTAEETWPFVLTMDGNPIAGAVLTLETALGSRVHGETDADGVARLTFPNDFPPPETLAEEAAGGHRMYGGRDRAAFVVSASLGTEVGAFTRTAAYNDTYKADDALSKSLPMGAAFLVFGMLVATPLLRRPSTKGAK